MIPSFSFCKNRKLNFECGLQNDAQGYGLIEGKKLSLKQALKTLKNLGLTETEAKVYVYLAKKGPREGTEIAKTLKLTKHQLCSSIERLLTKGMVNAIPELKTKYSAIAFEKVLDQLMKATQK
jgi:sugar-specific transcriptional regulator TrmB